MPVNSYLLGTKPRFEAVFTLISTGAFVDPDEVTFMVRNEPNQVNASFTYGAGEVSKLTVGHYYIEYEPLFSGPWRYRFEGSGAVVAVAERGFAINESEFYPG